MTEPTPGIGHNDPPEDLDPRLPTEFEKSEREINDLYDESKHWLDGEPVITQVQADAIAKLLRMLRDAEFKANQRRIQENEPFDKGKREVQERYAPLIANTKAVQGKTTVAIRGCKEALEPFLRKEAAAKRAEADRLKREADEKATAAREALQATTVDDLAAREKAEAQVQDALWAGRHASQAAQDKAKAEGGGRAVGLRTYDVATITDLDAFAKHVWINYQPALYEFLMKFAQQLVTDGVRAIPGVTVHQEERVV